MQGVRFIYWLESTLDAVKKDELRFVREEEEDKRRYYTNVWHVIQDNELHEVLQKILTEMGDSNSNAWYLNRVIWKSLPKTYLSSTKRITYS